MKNLSKILSVLGFAAVLIATSGCVQDQYRKPRYGARSPDINSKQWLTWVDQKVDTRYANGQRPEPGSQEWYAIVDHVVFTEGNRDYYYRNVYRPQYRQPNRNPAARHNYANDYYGPARFSTHDGSYRGSYNLGTIQWREAVTTQILSGRVPMPPPRSDPWDAPLAPTSDR